MIFKIIASFFLLLTLFAISYKYKDSFPMLNSDSSIESTPKVKRSYQEIAKQRASESVATVKVENSDSKGKVIFYSFDEENNESRYTFDLEKESYQFQSKEKQKKYIVSGELPSSAISKVRWNLEDDKVIEGVEGDLSKHSLYIFNRHLIYDSFEENENFIDGQWFFKDKSVCPKYIEDNLEYFHMSIAPHQESTHWYSGELRVHGAVVRHLNLKPFGYGENWKLRNLEYSCSFSGMTIFSKELKSLRIQLSGKRIGISTGESGSRMLLFKKQPFLILDMEGKYKGVSIAIDGISDEVRGEVTEKGMFISLRDSKDKKISFRGDSVDLEIYRRNFIPFEAKFEKGGMKGIGECMSTAVDTNDSLSQPLIYCLGRIEGKKMRTYGFLIRRIVE